MPSSEGTHRRMLDELIRSNAVDKRWAEELIAGAATLEDLERAAIGTADNRWRIPRFNGRARAGSAAHGEDLANKEPGSLAATQRPFVTRSFK